MNSTIRNVLLFLAVTCSYCTSYTQFSNSGFYDKDEDTEICRLASSFMSDEEVIDLINRMVSELGLENRFNMISCGTIENCQAVVYDSKPYILYNKDFLNRVKSLNFSETSLKKTDKENWEALTVLAHELGHHYNFHMTSPHPDKTNRDFELEADEFAGRMMAKLGASLEQAQSVFNSSSIPDEGTLNHPPRNQRLTAIKKGWKQVVNTKKTINSEYIVDESEVMELAVPTITIWKLIEPNDGEFEYILESENELQKQNTIFPEITNENVFQVSLSRLSNIDYYYFIEQDDNGKYIPHLIPNDGKKIVLPNEEYTFRCNSEQVQKLIILVSARNISEKVRQGLCNTSHLQDSNAILTYFSNYGGEHYYDGQIYPLVINIGK